MQKKINTQNGDDNTISPPKKDYNLLLQSAKVDSKTVFPDEQIFLTIGNNVIGSAGNFIALTGLPKSCKSTFVCGIIASAISGKEIFGFSTLLRAYENKDRVALFDTEQSGLDFQTKARQIQRLSGCKDIYENLDAFTVIEFSVWDILNMINTYLINTPNCAILVIDGILDLCNNMNDEREAKKLTKILRKWAKKHQCLIIIVLHLGKDKTAIGHIGSASSRYCQSQLEIAKTKNNTYTCEGKLLRSAGGFEPLEIIYSEKAKSFIQL